MSVQIYTDDNDDLYVLWSGPVAIYQHLRADGQHREVFKLPANVDKIYPTPLANEFALEDEYERGYEKGYESGYDDGQEQGYDAGLEAGRDW